MGVLRPAHAIKFNFAVGKFAAGLREPATATPPPAKGLPLVELTDVLLSFGSQKTSGFLRPSTAANAYSVRTKQAEEYRWNAGEVGRKALWNFNCLICDPSGFQGIGRTNA